MNAPLCFQLLWSQHVSQKALRPWLVTSLSIPLTWLITFELVLYIQTLPIIFQYFTYRRTNTKYGKFYIKYSAAKVWNDIPLGIRSSSSLAVFKKTVQKLHLITAIPTTIPWCLLWYFVLDQTDYVCSFLSSIRSSQTIWLLSYKISRSVSLTPQSVVYKQM